MVKSREPKILPPDVPVEEETIPGYDPKRFYPMNPGQVLRGQYKVLAKLGWSFYFDRMAGRRHFTVRPRSSPFLLPLTPS